MPRHDVSRLVLVAALSFLAGLLWLGESVQSLTASNKNMYRLYLADRAAVKSCARYADLIRALEVSRLHKSPLDQIRDAKELNVDSLPWLEGHAE